MDIKLFAIVIVVIFMAPQLIFSSKVLLYMNAYHQNKSTEHNFTDGDDIYVYCEYEAQGIDDPIVFMTLAKTVSNVDSQFFYYLDDQTYRVNHNVPGFADIEMIDHWKDTFKIRIVNATQHFKGEYKCVAHHEVGWVYEKPIILNWYKS
ncbi:uncharacterized protein LOC128963308 [Oppia nitens]|uniref:uncharacterized protein LOC128963308 n=1 Tax=Oppia nitens TaxID=1686743 RepID=UPI0023DA8C8A|nr:uncharacterized protein LOC128963308 [Oppia nitens]